MHDSATSLQSLNRINIVTVQLLHRYVRNIDLRPIDYVIIDEFHHAAARTYRAVMDSISPDYLLGLTATPFRGDNQDVLSLCQGNQLIFFDLRSGVNSGILSPYHYFGCFDNVDYTSIKFNNAHYDIWDLERALLIPARDQAIIGKWRQLAEGKPTLAFCCTHEHALRMATSFTAAGIPAAAYISTTPPQRRADLLNRLAAGEITVLCSVDIFNEGADIPFIECLLFLRPTESKRIFYQQLGRGLRQYVGKKQCIVVDFIGNFRNAYRIVEYLGLLPIEDESDSLDAISRQHTPKDVLNLPAGCEVEFDERVIDIFVEQTLSPLHASRHNIRRILIYQYLRLQRTLNRIPTKMDIHRSCLLGTDLYRLAFGSWREFLRVVGSW